MRILFVASPLQGHLLPLIPLALACRDVGHEVHVASGGFPPDMAGLRTHEIGARFSLRRSALRVSLGRPAMAMAEMKGQAGLGFVGELFGRANLDLVGPLLEVASGVHPDLIVYESLGEAGAVVAGRLSVPSVLQENTLWPGYDLFEAVTGSSKMRGLKVPAPELTLAVTPPSLAGLHAAARAAGPATPAAAAGAAGPGGRHQRWLRPVPFSGGGELPAWLDGPLERPLIVVSRSTIEGPNDGDPGPAVIAAAARVDADFVLVRPAKPADGLPPNVRTTGRIPLDRVLPRAAAFVHHGGAGSVLGGLAAGVPQLVTPGAGDRRHNARLLAERGAGLA
ncbi:glycosyltransferase, partial [Actinoplanes sp. NPDC051633]|uniref:glycosyltransferase n=1 Tax=Actinoplanes sp. NPDC051633 TaxID=3155670 RepID=UPI0034355067